MSEKPDSSLARMLSVLDLFDDGRTGLSVEAVVEALQVSQPTAYRYLRLLTEAGLLQRQGLSTLTLGPRIIELDHLIRRSDPLLRAVQPLLQALVAATGLDGVASALYGERMLDVHREYSGQPATLSYGRGRPRPLFLGAAPKIVLANLPTAQLRRLFDGRPQEVAAAGLPADWPAFRRVYARIRQDGYYASRGELEPTLAAVAAPVLWPDGRVAGALSLVTTVQRMDVIDLERLAARVRQAAQDASARLSDDGT